MKEDEAYMHRDAIGPPAIKIPKKGEYIVEAEDESLNLEECEQKLQNTLNRKDFEIRLAEALIVAEKIINSDRSTAEEKQKALRFLNRRHLFQLCDLGDFELVQVDSEYNIHLVGIKSRLIQPVFTEIKEVIFTPNDFLARIKKSIHRPRRNVKRDDLKKEKAEMLLRNEEISEPKMVRDLNICGRYLEMLELRGNMFEECLMVGASMSNSVQENVVYNKSRMNEVIFNESEFTDCQFRDSLLADSSFIRCCFKGTIILDNCDYGRLNANGLVNKCGPYRFMVLYCNLFDSNFLNAELPSSVWQNCDLRKSSLVRASLRASIIISSQFHYANCLDTDFEGVSMDGVSFWGAYLKGASFKGAKLDKIDFEGADVRLTDFTGSNVNLLDLSRAQNPLEAVLDDNQRRELEGIMQARGR